MTTAYSHSREAVVLVTPPHRRPVIAYIAWESKGARPQFMSLASITSYYGGSPDGAASASACVRELGKQLLSVGMWPRSK
jgi:hypothetical protein